MPNYRELDLGERKAKSYLVCTNLCLKSRGLHFVYPFSLDAIMLLRACRYAILFALQYPAKYLSLSYFVS